jgi:ribonuclease I
MPDVSIALVRESNKRLSSSAKKEVLARSSKLSKETINAMMKRAYERLSR